MVRHSVFLQIAPHLRARPIREWIDLHNRAFLGGVVLNLLVGFALSAHYSYAFVFAVAGMLHPASFLIVLALVGRIEPLAGTGG